LYLSELTQIRVIDVDVAKAQVRRIQAGGGDLEPRANLVCIHKQNACTYGAGIIITFCGHIDKGLGTAMLASCV
jgi:hypothetical protein